MIGGLTCKLYNTSKNKITEQFSMRKMKVHFPHKNGSNPNILKIYVI